MGEPTAATNAERIDALRRDLDRLERWMTRMVLLSGSILGGGTLIVVNALLKGSGLL